MLELRLQLVRAEMHISSYQMKLSYGHAKILTLLALISAIYWEDLESLVRFIWANDETHVALASLGMLGIYAFSKRLVFNDIINIKNAKLKIGVAFFLSSITIYLFGSYFDFKLIFHIASLALFVASYTLVRINDLTLRVISPTLVITIAISLLTIGGIFKTAISAIMLAAFASSATLFSNIKKRFKLSVLVLNAFLFYLIVASLTGYASFLLAILEFMVLLLIVMKGPFQHSAGKLREVMKNGPCYICSSGNATSDFCPFCGRNLAREVPRSKFEILEVALFISFFVASALISIPTLIGVNGEGVSLSYLTFQGAEQRALSSSSESWLLYERRWLNDYTQISPAGLALKEVLVPDRFPEVKNYTLILELTSLEPIIAKSWSFAPWKVQVSQSIMLRDSIPATYYEVSSRTKSLKILVWTGRVNLLLGENLVTKVCGISLLRNFTFTAIRQNLTYTSDPETVEFLEDAEQIAIKIIRDIELASGWSYILYSTNALMSLIGGPLLIILTSVTFISIAIFVASKGRVTESYLLEIIPKDRLGILLAIDRLRSSGIPTTGDNLLRALEVNKSGVIDGTKLMIALEDLEALKLVKRSIRLGTQKTYLEWTLAF